MTETKVEMPGTAGLGAVLHIGAGSGAGVPDYLAAGAREMVLVEPEAAFQPALAALSREHAGLQVKQGAAVAHLVEGGDTGMLQRFSFLELNSLKPAQADLLALFPGVYPLEAASVVLLDIVDLAQGMDLDQSGCHLLVLQAPGQALDLLQALQQAGLLEKFSQLRIQEGRQPLYEGAAPIGEIGEFLAQVGFGTGAVLGGVDPERPVLQVAADPDLTQKVSLRKHQGALAELKQVNKDLTARLEQAQAGEAGRATELEQARAALSDQLAAEKAMIQKHQAEVAVLKAAQAEALKAEVAAERKKHQDEVAALKAELAALKAAQAEALKAEVAAERKKQQEALNKAQQRIETLSETNTTVQQNMNVALRVQLLRENDLKDLQQRYAQLLQQKEAQSDLLQRVSSSLGYLLEESRADVVPEASSDQPPAMPSQAETASAPSKGARRKKKTVPHE